VSSFSAITKQGFKQACALASGRSTNKVTANFLGLRQALDREDFIEVFPVLASMLPEDKDEVASLLASADKPVKKTLEDLLAFSIKVAGWS
jgi:hypothetical protein